MAKGFLTDGQKDTIGVAVEFGHAASHRAFLPTTQQVMDGVEIVEHLLKDKYVLGPISNRLKSGVPPRPKGSP